MSKRECRICKYNELTIIDMPHIRSVCKVHNPHFIDVVLHIPNDVTTVIHPDSEKEETNWKNTSSNTLSLVVCPRCGNITYNLEGCATV